MNKQADKQMKRQEDKHKKVNRQTDRQYITLHSAPYQTNKRL